MTQDPLLVLPAFGDSVGESLTLSLLQLTKIRS